MNPKGHHGSILQLHLFLLLFSGHALAQTDDDGSDMYGESSRFDPNMAIFIIVLVSVFFTLGILSMYIRRCLERAIGMNNALTFDSGGNRLSLSRSQALGLDASVIDTFPTFLYSTVKMLMISKEALECPICLNEFEDAETLCLIPKCCHVFHPDCIDAWFRSHTTCPLCRANLVPVPGESVVSIQIPGLADDAPHSELTDGHWITIDSVALTCNQSMPRRSTNSHRASQHEENLDRFTLRLQPDIHNKLVDSSLSKGHMTFPQMMSSVSGYRTGSQDGRLERRSFSITPPYMRCSINMSPGGSGDQVHADTPKGLLLVMKSPFDRLFRGKNTMCKRSSDHLRSSHDSPSVDQVV